MHDSGSIVRYSAPEIKLLYMHFDLPLRGSAINRFRAAVIESAGREHDLFHNHTPDGGRLLRYPLIQYRVRHGHAAIVAMEEGMQAVQEWYMRTGGEVRSGDARIKLRVTHMEVERHLLAMSPEPRWYFLKRYLPFNPERYGQWLVAPSLIPRVELLERCLVAHVLTFARAMNWRLPERLDLCLQQIVQTKRVTFHGQPMVAFDLVFSANASLPLALGLGRAVSHGYGVCFPVRPFRKDDPEALTAMLADDAAGEGHR